MNFRNELSRAKKSSHVQVSNCVVIRGQKLALQQEKYLTTSLYLEKKQQKSAVIEYSLLVARNRSTSSRKQ
jgi:hypothetical protein